MSPRPTIGLAARRAVGLDDDQEPAFWPTAARLSNPDNIQYCAKAQLWIFCEGEASSPVSILHGAEDEGFTWQATGRQFADYSCNWGRLSAAYDTA